MSDLTDKFFKAIAEKKDAAIQEGLRELLSRGLLVWEETPLVLDPVSDDGKHVTTHWHFSGRLVLKNQEFIQRLESALEVAVGALESLEAERIHTDRDEAVWRTACEALAKIKELTKDDGR